jgi:hypothetical protein
VLPCWCLVVATAAKIMWIIMCVRLACEEMPSRAAQGRAGLWPSALYIFIAGAEHSPPQSMPGRCGAAGRSPQPIGAAAPSGAGCRRVQWHVKERASARAAARPPRPVQAVALAPACTPRDVPGIIFFK